MLIKNIKYLLIFMALFWEKWFFFDDRPGRELRFQAQSIAIKKFYQTLVILEEFEATGVLHRGVRCLYDRLRGVLDEAKGMWRAKNS